MSLRQKLIVIADRTQTITLAESAVQNLRVVSAPADLQVAAPTRTAAGWQSAVTSGGRRLAYAPLLVEADGQQVKIPTRILGTKECFVCAATTCNYHWGCPVDKIQQMEREGVRWQDWEGDGLTHHGINYPASQQMAGVAHAAGFPMTWIIDVQGAEAGGADIAGWHQAFGDDVAVMPSSYWHGNNVNYNTTRPVADAIAAMRYTRAQVQRALAAQGWPAFPLVMGVDQFVGSFGSHWIAAARANGFHGFWGTCFDHALCDSSCHHEGLPWDAYRVGERFFRYPQTGGSALWAYTWTVYDLCNSFLEYPNSGTFYNAEGDFIHRHQTDYYARNLRIRLDNMAQNDFACFVVHDEDHDIWRPELLGPMGQFFASAAGEPVTPATLEEVTQWLELRYPAGSHPACLLEAADPLTCHDAAEIMRNKLFTESPGFPSNMTWTPPHPPHWKSVNGHNPSVLLYYAADARWAVVEGERVPRQYIDYTKFDGCTETGPAPKETIPQLTDWQEQWLTRDGRRQLQVRFQADRPFPRLPIVFWDRPELRGTMQTQRTRVVFATITTGSNELLVDTR